MLKTKTSYMISWLSNIIKPEFVTKCFYRMLSSLRSFLFPPIFDPERRQRLDGKIVVVTGATAGIGEATVIECAKRVRLRLAKYITRRGLWRKRFHNLCLIIGSENKKSFCGAFRMGCSAFNSLSLTHRKLHSTSTHV